MSWFHKACLEVMPKNQQTDVFACEVVAGSVIRYLVFSNSFSFLPCSCRPGIACSHKTLARKFCHRFCFLGNSREDHLEAGVGPSGLDFEIEFPV